MRSGEIGLANQRLQPLGHLSVCPSKKAIPDIHHRKAQDQLAKLQRSRNRQRMTRTPSRKRIQGQKTLPKFCFERETVTAYRRLTPPGNPAFIIANHPVEQRRLVVANKLARQLSQRDVVSASLTRGVVG